MLAILDYKAGNLTSVRRALDHLGIPCKITGNAADLDSCDGIIFPGVGSAAQAMAELERGGLDAALVRAVNMGRPLLGICLGCQILLEASEEGETSTLGICRGKSSRFPTGMPQEDGSTAKIPHMGWNSLRRIRESALLKNVPLDAEFYFVHSYYVEPDPEMIIATSHHGLDFCAIYGEPGFWAVQFHPEKSGPPGLTVLANFNAYCMECANAV